MTGCRETPDATTDPTVIISLSHPVDTAAMGAAPADQFSLFYRAQLNLRHLLFLLTQGLLSCREGAIRPLAIEEAIGLCETLTAEHQLLDEELRCIVLSFKAECYYWLYSVADDDQKGVLRSRAIDAAQTSQEWYKHLTDPSDTAGARERHNCALLDCLQTGTCQPAATTSAFIDGLHEQLFVQRDRS